jgi:hypothetical protein
MNIIAVWNVTPRNVVVITNVSEEIAAFIYKGENKLKLVVI